MSISYISGNYGPDMNSVYQVNIDVSGWERTTIQVIPPVTGSFYIYGSSYDGNSVQMLDGNASLATSFTPLQATNLSTGTAVSVISSAGNYKVDVNTKFIRLQGSPAGAGSAVYGLLFNHTK